MWSFLWNLQPRGAILRLCHDLDPVLRGIFMHATNKILITLSAIGLATSFTSAGPKDRTSVSTFLFSAGSSITPIDLNNDCEISDVDVAIAVLNNLKAKYGEDYAVPDLNGDGVVTALDVHFAIAKILRASFGKVTQISDAVGIEDVVEVAIGVATDDISADVNVDGTADVNDVNAVNSQIGIVVDEADIAMYAWEIFSYIDAFETYGLDAFMAEGCAGAPSGHLEGISNTWPPYTNGWPANHLTTLTQSWGMHNGEHTTWVSSRWPPNHEVEMSNEWPLPHRYIVSGGGEHTLSVSSQWPANHTETSSSSWGGNHEVTVSRGWPPNHTSASSAALDYPPAHTDTMSNTWGHETQLSANEWPPNHQVTVSQGWGSGHDPGASSQFPPGHVIYASNSWPGPNPWPPSHALSVSESWGEPGPGGWPPFPPDHNWWDTANDITD